MALRKSKLRTVLDLFSLHYHMHTFLELLLTPVVEAEHELN